MGGEQWKLMWQVAAGVELPRQFSGRPHRERPEAWLLVPAPHVLCDPEQVIFLLWAYCLIIQ